MISSASSSPSLKTKYFIDNKWEQSWQDEALAITQRVFDEDYRGTLPAVGDSAHVRNPDGDDGGDKGEVWVCSQNLFLIILFTDI